MNNKPINMSPEVWPRRLSTAPIRSSWAWPWRRIAAILAIAMLELIVASLCAMYTRTMWRGVEIGGGDLMSDSA
jgi:hypothetical protein